MWSTLGGGLNDCQVLPQFREEGTTQGPGASDVPVPNKLVPWDSLVGDSYTAEGTFGYESDSLRSAGQSINSSIAYGDVNAESSSAGCPAMAHHNGSMPPDSSHFATLPSGGLQANVAGVPIRMARPIASPPYIALEEFEEHRSSVEEAIATHFEHFRTQGSIAIERERFRMQQSVAIQTFLGQMRLAFEHVHNMPTRVQPGPGVGHARRRRRRRGPKGCLQILNMCSQAYSLKDPVEDCCTICMEDMLVGEELRFLPCGHMLHEGCATKYYGRGGVAAICPICRRHVCESSAATQG